VYLSCRAWNSFLSYTIVWPSSLFCFERVLMVFLKSSEFVSLMRACCSSCSRVSIRLSSSGSLLFFSHLESNIRFSFFSFSISTWSLSILRTRTWFNISCSCAFLGGFPRSLFVSPADLVKEAGSILPDSSRMRWISSSCYCLSSAESAEDYIL